MPVLRYFVFVGGALLVLLFICDAVFPPIPLPATLKSGSDLPAVRIQSERRWPERVVIDTSVPMVAPVKMAGAGTAQQATTTADAAKAKVREAFAQLSTAESKQQTSSAANPADTVAAKAAQPAALKVASATAPKAGGKPQPKRRVARTHPSHPLMLVAQQPQPHFGFFGSTW
jgi:hypothetical protein